jgi:cysteine desulfurase/selenocysteine lyase
MTQAALKPQSPAFDVNRVRADFPILQQKVHDVPLVYLDNAASAQKPRAVLEAMDHFYQHDYANVHRGVHALSQRATDLYEGARETVRRFLNAASADEIVFVRGGTEGINLVAHSWGRKNLQKGDEVLITELEHHANIVPWQMLVEEKGIVLKTIAITETGEIPFSHVENAITPRTKLISVAHISNALGTILPVESIINLAKSRNIPVLLDGCQGVLHQVVDVQKLSCDFYVFSSHKLYGPTGIGVLYGKKARLTDMPPYQTGGDMIESVTFAKTTFKAPPGRFEAGTPAIAEAVGLAAAIDYLNTIGVENIAKYESELLDYATMQLAKIPGLRLIGTAANKASILSFVMEQAHPHDVATILDRYGIAVRAGHHCAQPLMERLGLAATTRASIAFYNTREDIDALVTGLNKVREIFA